MGLCLAAYKSNDPTVSEIVEKIQEASIKRLQSMLQASLDGVERAVVDQIGSFLGLSQQQDGVLAAFVTNLNHNFDELLDKEIIKDEAVFDFENLSLVKEEELDVIVALEGMVNYCRNDHLANFISFNTRLNSLFPRKRIDESTNPLDPEQIATSFQEALRPLGLDAQNSLAVYRAFNRGVLRNLDEVLREANQILIDGHVIPDLGMEGQKKTRTATRRSGPRKDATTFGTVEEESFDEDEEQPELFSMMQNLLHTDAPAAATSTTGDAPVEQAGGSSNSGEAPPQYMIPTTMIPAGVENTGGATAPAEGSVMQPFQPAAGQEVQMVDQNQLMEILSTIQKSLEVRESSSQIPENMEQVEKLNISESLGQILNADQQAGVINAVDRQSSDVINLVAMLYEAIWDDDSVPIPIKELIGRTQVTIIKVALSDNEFFNRENHPARAILNEYAAAGIGWTEVEKLEEDPLYQKIQQQVNQILLEYEDDISFFENLIEDFRSFRIKEAAKTRKLEQSILKADERHDRLEDIHELVTQKIDERVLGRELHPFVSDLLQDQFHRFMVMLVLKEGPGSNAWKQAINTIDVLLWSVQPHEQEGDRDRLETINSRLLNNLRKAMRIVSVDAADIDTLITTLQSVQLASFGDVPEEEPKEKPEEPVIAPVEQEGLLSLEVAQEKALAATEEETPLNPEAIQLSPDDTGAEEPPATTESPEIEATTVELQKTEETKQIVETKEAKEAKEPEEPQEDLSEYISQVDSLNAGMWVEFAGEEEQNTRCKLAAKINAIDKFIFVNRQGVKVVEKTKNGLAQELKDGTVKIISDGLLFSRALESVIGNLRENSHREQTGGAYQPQAAS